MESPNRTRTRSAKTNRAAVFSTFIAERNRGAATVLWRPTSLFDLDWLDQNVLYVDKRIPYGCTTGIELDLQDCFDDLLSRCSCIESRLGVCA